MTHPTGNNTDDPWVLRPAASPGEPVAGSLPETPALHIARLPRIAPLDSQWGVATPRTVPEALEAAIFSPPAAPDGGPEPLHSYAIVEAARVRHLPEILRNSDLAHRCLFKGEAFDSMKEVAPWLVQLREGSSFTRSLFTRSKAHWHLWDSEPALYIRSRASIDQLWQHLRKFTRIRDAHGRWFYCRFWEPKWAEALLVAMKPADQARFMAAIDALIVVQKDGQAAALSFGKARPKTALAQSERAS